MRDAQRHRILDAGRNELAEKEQNEINILSDFLPEQLSEEELNLIVTEVIKETASAEERDLPSDENTDMDSILKEIESAGTPTTYYTFGMDIFIQEGVIQGISECGLYFNQYFTLYNKFKCF